MKATACSASARRIIADLHEILSSTRDLWEMWHAGYTLGGYTLLKLCHMTGFVLVSHVILIKSSLFKKGKTNFVIQGNFIEIFYYFFLKKNIHLETTH